MEQFTTHSPLIISNASRSQFASLVTRTTSTFLVLFLLPVPSLSCAPAIDLSARFRSNVSRCGGEADNKKSCCCCYWSSSRVRTVAQDVRHPECEQLGHGQGKATVRLGRRNPNGGALKRKASATIDDDDGDDTRVHRDDWWAYLLLSADSRNTYVGVSSNVVRRLRQHNGELAGGAKAARAGRPWQVACTVGSFSTRSEACQFEWRWKKLSKSTLGMDKAVAGDLPLSAPPKKLLELPVILRRWTALMQAQNAVQEWKQVQVDWHSEE